MSATSTHTAEQQVHDKLVAAINAYTDMQALETAYVRSQLLKTLPTMPGKEHHSLSERRQNRLEAHKAERKARVERHNGTTTHAIEQLVAEGLKNSEIAKQLDVRPQFVWNVRRHLQSQAS